MWILIVVIFVLIYVWYKNRFLYWKKLGFPYVPGEIPFGSLGKAFWKEHLSEVVKRQYDEFKDKGPAYGTFFMSRPTLVPTDPELIKDILVRNFEIFHDHGLVYNEKADPLNGHLFFVNGQEWKDLRAKLSPTFTSGKMKMMFPTVSSTADRMIDYLKPFAARKEQIEIKEVFSSFATEVIANVALGLEIECLGNPQNPFRKMAKSVFEPTPWNNMKSLVLISFETLGRFLNFGFNTKETTDFFMGTVKDNLNYREKNKVQRNDFFQLLINIKNSDVGMTFDEIAANSFVFFVAGFETSSSVMTFCTYELALNQDIQEKLRDEIEETFQNHNENITYDEVKNMKYLDMVFNETLRKYPILESHFRKSTKDFPIPNSNLIIPADTPIMIPAIGLHHDERYYENPEIFDPERFTPENVQKRQPFTYMPFSDGPRQCIGMRFGIMQTKIGVVKLLRNFKIMTCTKTINPMQFKPNASFQTPIGGLWLKLEDIS